MLMEHRQEYQYEHLTLPEQVVRLFRDSDTEFTRFMSAIGMALWATVLLWPGDTLGASRTLIGITRYGTDVRWGARLAIAALLIGITAPLLNLPSIPDSKRHYIAKLHALGLFVACIWWGYLVWSIWVTTIFSTPPSPPTTGLAAYPTFAIGAIWAFLRFMARHDVIRRRVR